MMLLSWASPAFLGDAPVYACGAPGPAFKVWAAAPLRFSIAKTGGAEAAPLNQPGAFPDGLLA